MKNKDIEQLSREQLAQKFNEALKTEDTEQVAQAMAEMAAGIEEEILQRAKDVAAVEQLDAQAMAARGLRQLTSEEKKYYEAVIGAMKSENPKQALASIDVTMPKTIIEDVYDSLKLEHPLLAKIDFKNTSYITEWIMNKNGKQKAIWGRHYSGDHKGTGRILREAGHVNVQLDRISSGCKVHAGSGRNMVRQLRARSAERCDLRRSGRRYRLRNRRENAYRNEQRH